MPLPTTISIACSNEFRVSTHLAPPELLIVISLNDIEISLEGIDYWKAFRNFEYESERYAFTFTQLERSLHLCGIRQTEIAWVIQNIRMLTGTIE